MKPVNIYRVSRIQDEELFNIATKHEASDHDNHRTPIHEIGSLRILVDALRGEGVSVKDTDGFYFGYIIPQIGKEFDLVKVTDKYCLNIELKSQDVTEEHIAAQLRKNRHFLNLLGRELMLFTVVTDTMTCYVLDQESELRRTEIGEIARALKKCSSAYHGRIDKLFKASEYLIAPDRQPEKFLNRQYFLTPAQDQVKKDLFRKIQDASGCAFYHITGKPCTGKTLLLYDIARDLVSSGRTLIVCGSEVTEGLAAISDAIRDLDFITSSDLNSEGQLEGYDYVLVDETLHLQAAIFDTISDGAKRNNQICIFSTDQSSLLTKTQEEENITDKMRGLEFDGVFELSEKLRMNMEIYTFILKLKHLGAKTDKNYDFGQIDISFANDVNEARDIISFYRSKDYKFINAHITPDDPFADLAEKFSPNHIVGREYSRAVMLMDDSFSYDGDGYLQGIPRPDPENLYPNLFYQGITRVRDSLSIVVLDAPELLRSILSIIG